MCILGTKFSTSPGKAVDGVYLESAEEFQRGQGLRLPPSQGNNTKIIRPFFSDSKKTIMIIKLTDIDINNNNTND